jgi:cytidine deaminase
LKEPYADLVAAACRARLNSYSPYSGFRVGAALLAAGGEVYEGTNVENASFGLSICAERAAVFRAVAAGARDFLAIAICADGVRPTPPCGACRQVLLEFNPDLAVLTAGEEGTAGEVRRTTLRELVPDAFLTFLARDDRAGSGEDAAP